MCGDGAWENPAHQHDDFANHQFCNRTGIRKWCIEDRNAALACSFQLNLISPNREATDCDQAVSRSKNLFSQLRPRTNSDDMCRRNRFNQIGFIQRLRQMRDIGVTGSFEVIDGRLIEALQ